MNLLRKIDNYLLEDMIDDTERLLITRKVAPENEIRDIISKFKVNRTKANGIQKDIAYWKKQPWDEFKSFVISLEKVKTKREEIRSDKGDVITAFSNNDVKVIIPKTESASCTYGSGTKWCTSGEIDNHFKEYLHKKGHTLYYIIVKNGIDKSLMYSDKFVTKYHGNGDKGRQHGGQYTVDEILDEQKQIRDLYMKVPQKTYNRVAVLVRNEKHTPEQIAAAKAKGRIPARLTQAFDVFDNFMKDRWLRNFMERYNIPEDTFILRTEKDKEGNWKLRE